MHDIGMNRFFAIALPILGYLSVATSLYLYFTGKVQEGLYWNLLGMTFFVGGVTNWFMATGTISASVGTYTGATTSTPDRLNKVA
jgi:hypothetical protein